MARSAVAVVGAGGFLGRAVVSCLAARGVPAVTFTRQSPVLDRRGDLAPQLADCYAVSWLATVITPHLAATQPERVTNEVATFQAFLSEVEKLPEPPRVVLASSGGTIYDPSTPPPYREQSPTRPHSEYGRAKLRLEDMLRASTVPGIILRVANAYGPGQPVAAGQAVLAHWMHAICQGRPITVFGSLDTARDYVYIDDIAQAFVAAATHPGPLPEVVNVASGEPTRLGTLLDILTELACEDIEVRHEPARSFDVARTWLAVELARDAFGWQPTTGLPDGIATAWADARGRANGRSPHAAGVKIEGSTS
ncbi:MAG TPA: NAD-dependent epimerase/dehydratase family protein [Mycobacteriales bacterium]